MDISRPTPRHIITQFSNAKDKERISKAVSERTHHIQGTLNKQTSPQKLALRGRGLMHFKYEEKANGSEESSIQQKPSFKSEGEINYHSACLVRNAQDNPAG